MQLRFIVPSKRQKGFPWNVCQLFVSIARAKITGKSPGKSRRKEKKTRKGDVDAKSAHVELDREDQYNVTQAQR